MPNHHIYYKWVTAGKIILLVMNINMEEYSVVLQGSKLFFTFWPHSYNPNMKIKKE